jgi:hypothetical protein
MFGPVVARTIRVRCPNPACAAPARTAVPLYFAAPGVIALPRLTCASCGCECEEVTGA